MSMIERNKKQGLVFLKEYSGPCPYCGYTLKNPTSRLCPECGSKLRVVVCAPFRFSPWHALLASIAITTGVFLDRVILTLVGMFFWGSRPIIEWELLSFSVVPFALLCGCFYIVWQQKVRLTSMSRLKRVAWYAVAIVAPLVMSVGALFGLRWLLGHL